MKSLMDKLIFWVAPLCAATIIRFLYRCLKPHVVNENSLLATWAQGRKVIFAFWHDQLLMMPPVYKGEKVKVLISPSKDGELIARTISFFSMETIRGSSNRGGREALWEMITLPENEVDLGITPDGPKGPRHEVKFGAAKLAQSTGRPIVPVAFACSHGHRFKSWDRFLVPYPWGKAVYCLGEPLIAGEDESLQNFQSRVQKAMDTNTHQAKEYLKRYDVSAL